MKQHEQALLYLQKAAEDEVLLDEVIESARVSDAAIGFHCQQAAEKLLKALLSHLGIRFRRTHDLKELMDLAVDSGMEIPGHLIELDLLTPYAVEFRYDLLPLELEVPLDRQGAQKMIRELRAWVENILNLIRQEPEISDN
jgi:HEPN domain-containing protein